MKKLLFFILILGLWVGTFAFVEAKNPSPSKQCRMIGIQKIKNKKFKTKRLVIKPAVKTTFKFQVEYASY